MAAQRSVRVSVTDTDLFRDLVRRVEVAESVLAAVAECRVCRVCAGLAAETLKKGITDG